MKYFIKNKIILLAYISGNIFGMEIENSQNIFGISHNQYCGILFNSKSNRGGYKVDYSDEIHGSSYSYSSDEFEEFSTSSSNDEDSIINISYSDQNKPYKKRCSKLKNKIEEDSERLTGISRVDVGQRLGVSLSIALTKFFSEFYEFFHRDILSDSNESLDEFIEKHRDAFLSSLQKNLIGGEDATVDGLLNHADGMVQNILHDYLAKFIEKHRDDFFNSIQEKIIGGEDATINGLLDRFNGEIKVLFGIGNSEKIKAEEDEEEGDTDQEKECDRSIVGILTKFLKDIKELKSKTIQDIREVKSETIQEARDSIYFIGNKTFWGVLILMLIYKIDLPFLFEKAELYGWVTVKKDVDQHLEQKKVLGGL